MGFSDTLHPVRDSGACSLNCSLLWRCSHSLASHDSPSSAVLWCSPPRPPPHPPPYSVSAEVLLPQQAGLWGKIFSRWHSSGHLPGQSLSPWGKAGPLSPKRRAPPTAALSACFAFTHCSRQTLTFMDVSRQELGPSFWAPEF